MAKDNEDLLDYSPDMAKNFFKRSFNSANFFACWRYMDGILDVEASSELGQYFCKSISSSHHSDV